jgi:hypothetical protein
LREGDLLVFMMVMVMVTMVVIETHCVHGFLQFRGARISRAGRITRGSHAIPISEVTALLEKENSEHPWGTSDDLEYLFGHRTNSNDLFVSFFTIG